MTIMKKKVTDAFHIGTATLNRSSASIMDDSYHGDLSEIECIRDLKKTDYFERV